MRPIARVTALALDTADAAGIAKRLRNLKTSELHDASPAMLRRCAAQLRAAAYSLTTAARRFDHRADLIDHERREALK